MKLPMLTVIALGFASASAQAQDSREFATRKALDEHYEAQFADLDKQRIADLAALAPKLKDQEAEGVYYDLFNLAVTRSQYEAAEKSAEAFLQGGKGSPQTRALATFVNIIAASERNEFREAEKDLAAFLKSASTTEPVSKMDPNLIFAVGESFLQRLIRAQEYEIATQVCTTFTTSTFDPAVKAHFDARLRRIQMLGKPAPAISASDIDGNPVSLAEAKGKVVLVDFWATWAPPCVAQIPKYNALQSKYGEKGFQVIGVNVDNAVQNIKDKGAVAQHVREFLLAMQTEWPSVMNGTGKTDFAKSYGVTDVPSNFLIDRDGKIIQVELNDLDLEKAIERAIGGEKAGKPASPAK